MSDEAPLRDRRIGELARGAAASATPAWIAGRVVAVRPGALRLRDESGEVDVVGAVPITVVRRCGCARAAGRRRRATSPPIAATCSACPPRGGRDAEWDDAGLAKRARSCARDRLLAAIRSGFRAEGFLEVETPTLIGAPGQEPHLRPFETAFHGRRSATPLWLATSPEYAMKRLLAMGCERIFQLGRGYRDGPDENSPLHAPEFTLCEWYRAFEGLDAIARDVERLLAQGAAALAVPTRIERGGRGCDVARPGEWITVAEAFRRHADVDLAPYLDDDDERFLATLPSHWLRAVGGPRARADSAYFRILIELVEPHLGIERPTFLHAYPARHAALAELDAGDARVAKRFEVYVAGIELGNAFDELRDAGEQEKRLRAESDERVRAGGAALPVDAVPDALRSGRRCAGIALGVDRLHLLLGARRSPTCSRSRSPTTCNRRVRSATPPASASPLWCAAVPRPQRRPPVHGPTARGAVAEGVSSCPVRPVRSRSAASQRSRSPARRRPRPARRTASSSRCRRRRRRRSAR
jgi:lysyl-tRNA synthetase class 2